ncbi:MAG TPA: HupE/UreJ family protein [Phnomibacter sp.]|nr:HupE/UreJ family protein [Phnomibacter sp.]
MFSDYFAIGWEHILAWGAWDHLLFILALSAIYSFSEWKQVIILVTAFTIGHSITLALSMFEMIRYSGDWIEFLIPCTIVVTAISNTFIKKYGGKGLRINYFFALFFGLIHGMGFASGLKSLLGREVSIAIPLLGFNLGLEAGQIVAVVALLIFAFLVLNVLRANRRDYVLFMSGGAAMAALIMALDRLPC